jgi:hypothetical protein
MKKLLLPALLLCSPVLLSAVELKSHDGDLTIHVEVVDSDGAQRFLNPENFQWLEFII